MLDDALCHSKLRLILYSSALDAWLNYGLLKVWELEPFNPSLAINKHMTFDLATIHSNEGPSVYKSHCTWCYLNHWMHAHTKRMYRNLALVPPDNSRSKIPDISISDFARILDLWTKQSWSGKSLPAQRSATAAVIPAAPACGRFAVWWRRKP